MLSKARNVNSILILVFLLLSVITVALVYNLHLLTSTPNLNLQTYTDVLGREYNPGVMELETDTFGDTRLPVVGLVNDAYEKGNNYYLEILIPVNDKNTKLILDLGTNDMQVSNAATLVNGGPLQNPKSGDSVQITHKFLPVKEIVEKYKNKKGLPVYVKVIISMDGYPSDECNEECQLMVEQAKKYSINNQQLIEGDFDNNLAVGPVISIRPIE